MDGKLFHHRFPGKWILVWSKIWIIYFRISGDFIHSSAIDLLLLRAITFPILWHFGVSTWVRCPNMLTYETISYTKIYVLTCNCLILQYCTYSNWRGIPTCGSRKSWWRSLWCRNIQRSCWFLYLSSHIWKNNSVNGFFNVLLFNSLPITEKHLLHILCASTNSLTTSPASIFSTSSLLMKRSLQKRKTGLADSLHKFLVSLLLWVTFSPQPSSS